MDAVRRTPRKADARLMKVLEAVEMAEEFEDQIITDREGDLLSPSDEELTDEISAGLKYSRQER